MNVSGAASAATFVGTEALRKRYVRNRGESEQEITLTIRGISCAGCIPGLESGILSIRGVKQAAINRANFRATISWNPHDLDAEDLLAKIEALGYAIEPYQALQQEQRVASEKRIALRRILIAVGLGMQVMMITVALYFGEAMGMDEIYEHVLRYAAMLLTLPVLIISARPFFVNAWSGIKRGSLNVDLPVSMALLLAYGGSVFATLGFPGQVYFESVVMFVVLLLSARYLEVIARYKSIASISEMEKSVPEVATRIEENGQRQVVDVNELRPGDRVLVSPGSLVPADGVVTDGSSRVDESIISGESAAVPKQPGDFVLAGSVNIENTVTLTVNRAAPDSMVANLVKMTSSSRDRQSGGARLADSLARQFVWGLLLIALFAGGYWWLVDREMWLPVVISTLVVACPCALALATPTAFTAVMSRLAGRGILPIQSGFLDHIRRVDHVIFDKTGTLTEGRFSVEKVETDEHTAPSRAAGIAAALSRDNRHPLSLALSRFGEVHGVIARNVEFINGAGALGDIRGQRYALGSAQFIRRTFGHRSSQQNLSPPGPGRSICLLANQQGILARFEFADTLRPEARSIVDALRQNGISVSIYSGDNENAVAAIATALGITDFHGGMLPEEKRRQAEFLIQSGKRIAVVGDGLNDAPLISCAPVSIAMGDGADLSKLSADVVLMNNNLQDLLALFEAGSAADKVIRQNYAWAAAYNLLAIPAAIFGLVPPWAAALGMSLSSLIVSANSLRLTKSRSGLPRAESRYETEVTELKNVTC